jgi:hypothetical protein
MSLAFASDGSASSLSEDVFPLHYAAKVLCLVGGYSNYGRFSGYKIYVRVERVAV